MVPTPSRTTHVEILRIGFASLLKQSEQILSILFFFQPCLGHIITYWHGFHKNRTEIDKKEIPFP